MNITIREIAQKAHCSIATVSRALNEDVRVKDSTRSLVMTIARELGYRPNLAARNLVKRNTKIIGLVLPDIQGDFFTEIIKGVDEVLFHSGYHMIVASSHSQRSIIDSLINFLGQGLADGVILVIPAMSERIKELVDGRNIPVVMVNGKSDLKSVDSITIDNFQGAFSMTEFLIEKGGYSEIAFIKGPSNNNDANLRLKGYLAALAKHDIPVRNEWIIQGDFTSHGGGFACSRLLSLIDKPKVIFTANDMMAFGCFQAVESLGLKVPDDIGIAGFDHIFTSDFLSPKLTTVHVPTYEIGKTAAGLLLDRIEQGAAHTVQHVKISTGLIIGSSCRHLL